jgi:hypothetical protein
VCSEYEPKLRTPDDCGCEYNGKDNWYDLDDETDLTMYFKTTEDLETYYLRKYESPLILQRVAQPPKVPVPAFVPLGVKTKARPRGPWELNR